LRPDITPKPQNNRSAHPTTMTTSGQEMELANCSDIKSLVCWNEAEIERMEERSSVCCGVCGAREATMSLPKPGERDSG
jgi:hypothetical protein